MAFAKTNDGQEIYYEVYGSTGPILVLVSGYMGIANIWQPLIARLASKYRCIAYDSRGYGRSSKPESPGSYNVPQHATDLEAVVQAAKINEPFVLVTHSMGGNIASAFYLANPTKVSQIIYTGTYYDGKAMRPILPYDALASGVDEPSKCVEFYTNMGLDRGIAIEAAKWPAHGRRNNAKCLLSFDIGDGYASITVPTLIIQGEKDAATSVEQLVKPMAKALPNCRLEVLKGVSHFPPTEAPEELKRLIDEFVRAAN
ncbi:putative alpha/beta fold family hydrolase [Aspergillus leporis]|jgi:pimeloyl-ACP methyl ester carboxylesterase|uniref:Putative alpha/beta fold family hydrolase n=1 Tax=Aspergillus leporis TaxID=41062 RepID=A0A5N5X6J6_9EURO|nr:putative alpha/beta fold family hydrolase [Aspergillus leporis]